jgi:hypothetical protein
MGLIIIRTKIARTIIPVIVPAMKYIDGQLDTPLQEQNLTWQDLNKDVLKFTTTVLKTK